MAKVVDAARGAIGKFGGAIAPAVER